MSAVLCPGAMVCVIVSSLGQVVQGVFECVCVLSVCLVCVCVCVLSVCLVCGLGA